MKNSAVLLLLGTIACLSLVARSGAAPLFLGIEGRGSAPEPPPAILAGEKIVLRLLLPPPEIVGAPQIRLLQTGGKSIEIPLPSSVTLDADPADPRVTLARFTAPALERIASLTLDFGPLGVLPLEVFPVPSPRTDPPVLAEAFTARGLRLLVAGRSTLLRHYLRGEKLEFEDLGPESPDRLDADSLLLAELSPAAWRDLSAETVPAGARLLAFVSDPALLPGVYAESAARRTKITLPLLARLSDDPRARHTLHTVLLQTLTSAD